MANDITVPGGKFLGSFGGFSVVLVRKGERYGLDNCLTHEKHDPLIEFYDAGVTGKGFPSVGQFVSRYYWSTLSEGYVHGRGLCLHGGVAAWSIAAGPLADALAAVEVALDFG